MSDLTTHDLLISPLDALKAHFVKLEIAKVTLESTAEYLVNDEDTVYRVNQIEMAMEEFDKAYKELVEAYRRRPMKMYAKTLDDLTKLPDVEQISVQVKDEQITWTDESNAPIIDFMLRLNELHKKD